MVHLRFIGGGRLGEEVEAELEGSEAGELADASSLEEVRERTLRAKAGCGWPRPETPTVVTLVALRTA